MIELSIKSNLYSRRTQEVVSSNGVHNKDSISSTESTILSNGLHS